jgi:hypothetical protein
MNGRLNQARIPMPRRASPCDRDSETARKQSHDEKSRFCRIDNDAGCDLRTGACGHGSTEAAVLAQSDRPLSPASGTRLQCFRSGDRDANGRAQYAPLSWRTEIELLTLEILDMALANDETPQHGFRHRRGRAPQMALENLSQDRGCPENNRRGAI